MVAAALYDKYDYALEVAAHFLEKGHYSPGGFAEICALLEKLGNPRILLPKFRGAYRLANLLERFANRLKSRYWARYDG